MEKCHGALKNKDIRGDAAAGYEVEQHGKIGVQRSVYDCRIFPIEAGRGHQFVSRKTLGSDQVGVVVIVGRYLAVEDIREGVLAHQRRNHGKQSAQEHRKREYRQQNLILSVEEKKHRTYITAR